MQRYEAYRAYRENLFAFIMPAGHGKSTLAKKYGFVDVDMLITEAEHDDFVAMRAEIMLQRQGWQEHNKLWYARINRSLDMLDYSMPVIILLHTEELALEVGAQVMGCLTLDERTFTMNTMDRRGDSLNMHFTNMSYRQLQVSARVPNQVRCTSNRELEGTLLAIMNLSHMPVACPWKFSEERWNNCYDRTVPRWVLKGERAGDRRLNTHYLVELFEDGKIPKECVEYYVRHSYVPSQFDFGVSMYEWSILLAEVAYRVGDRSGFDVNSDMLSVFPPRSAKEISRANVTIRHLVQTFDIWSHADAVEIAEYHVGAPHVFVTSLLCAWKGILQRSEVSPFVKKWLGVKFPYWSNTLKNIHSYVRTSRFLMNTEITEQDRQGIMYMDLLVGRSEYTIDEAAEVRLRQSTDYSSKHLSYDPDKGVYTSEQYQTDFEAGIQLAYLRIKTEPRKVNIDSFIDFYQRRSTWITKGGLVYNKLPSWMKTFTASALDPIFETVIDIKGRHNKKSLFEMQELYQILVGVDRDNFNVTKTMIKYETGKKDRTLLPGSLAHFIVFSYVLLMAEKQDQIGSVRLNAASDNDIRYFDKKMSTGLFHVLYDWADFNEQHSAQEMARVISHLTDVVPPG